MNEPQIIEGEARDVTPSAVVRHEPQGVVAYDPQRQGAIFALGSLSVEDFDRHVTVITSGLERLRELQRRMLNKGSDYDTLPGTGERVVLLKPGAEKLSSFASLVPTFDTAGLIEKVTGHVDRITYTVATDLHYGSKDGPVVGSGIGVCTSYEKKYRWRDAKPICPVCHVEVDGTGTVNTAKSPQTGFYCWRKLGGCGATFTASETKITGQTVGQVEVEPWEQQNTIAKMAEKRSFVDAVIRTLNASSLFTQDMEPGDGGGDYVGDASSAASEPRSAARAPAAAQSTAPSAAEGPGTFTGKVNETPDGVRQQPDGTPRLEIRFKVDNRQHTAVVTGPLARAAVEDGRIVSGADVAIRGVRKEQDYPNRGNKPKKKVIESVDRIAVAVPDGDKNRWHIIEPLTLPLEDSTVRGPIIPATPSTASASGAADDASTTSASGEPYSNWDTSDEGFGEPNRPPGGALDDDDLFPDLVPAAAAIFESVMDELPIYRGVPEEPLEQRVAIISFDRTPTLRRHLWAIATHPADGSKCRIEAVAVPGGDLVPGETVRIAGEWRSSKVGMVLTASEVTP